MKSNELEITFPAFKLIFVFHVSSHDLQYCTFFALLLRIQIGVCVISSAAWSQASYSIQQLPCKMLLCKRHTLTFITVNKRLRATVGYCGYWDMAQLGIWHFLRLHMEIVFAAHVPENSLFAPAYRTLHFLLWSWDQARTTRKKLNYLHWYSVVMFFEV